MAKHLKSETGASSIYKKCIVRTPYFSNSDIKYLSSADSVKRFCNNLAFQEAIYLASPVLYKKCIQLLDNKIEDPKEVSRVVFSLTKYILRMCTRPTPFGTFAGCSVMSNTDETTRIELSDETEYTRVVRFDMLLLCEIARNIELFPEARESLSYFPNSSLYLTNGKYRYVEYGISNGARSYRTVEIKETAEIQRILKLSENGISIQNITIELISEGFEQDEVKAFVADLIDTQILVSELEPNLTGPDYFGRICEFLNSQDHPILKSTREIINSLREHLSAVNNSRDANFVEAYEELKRLVHTLPFKIKARHLFQVDLFKPAKYSTINNVVGERLIDAAKVVNKLAKPYQNPSMAKFIEKFLERYDLQEMPLSQVLDPQIGIGYPVESVNDNLPLVNDLLLEAVSRNTSPDQFSNIDSLLFTKYVEALRNGQDEIIIYENDLKTIHDPISPPCGVVMGELVNSIHSGQQLILITPGGGSSAANLIARFAHLNEDILETARAIAHQEQLASPDAILFEIVHLPEARVGNILTRPNLRALEFSYLAKHSGSSTNKIDLSDIFISIRSGKVVLKSAKQNCTIVPKLTNAHNFSTSKLPVYRFLCELQNQDRHIGVFRWPGLINSQRVLPRVKYNSVVVAPASWNFSLEDLTFLTFRTLEDRIVGFRKWVKIWKLPRFFVLAEGDNELFFDSENDFLLDVLFNEIKKKSRIVLRESFEGYIGSQVKGQSGKGYSNQFIFFFKNENRHTNRPAASLKIGRPANLSRKYLPGSEWLYFKIYCDSKNLDELLISLFAPLVNKLTEDGLIYKWFFIRFRDPESHLRIRFHVSSSKAHGETLLRVNELLTSKVKENIVWAVQLDTYSRELERYGPETIDLAEQLFCIDSETTLKLLRREKNHQWDVKQWMLTVLNIHLYFIDFSINLDDEIRILTRLRELFSKEFNLNKPKRVRLDQKYRKARKLLELVMERDLSKLDKDLQEGIAVVEDRSRRMASVVNLIRERVDSGKMEGMIESYLHMSINRTFRSKQRQHELVVYDFALKYLTSLKARRNQSLKSRQAVQL